MTARPLAECDPSRFAGIKLVLSDMDGTWLGAGHAPTEGGLAAIAEAEAAGFSFAMATGRCPASAHHASRLDLSTRPGIYSNGAVVRGTGGAELYTLDLPESVLK